MRADAGTAPHETDPLTSCTRLVTAAPQTLNEALAHINALPFPVSLECFVASLPRPLRVVATRSVFSLQPAEGPESPRIFLLTGGLVLSVVPTGAGASLLELSEWVSEGRTLKGELEFPVEQPLEEGAAFERLDIGDVLTSCGFCHREEEPHPSQPGGFVSLAFGLLPGMEVSLEELQTLRERCGAPRERDPEHCSMLRALFDYGALEQGAFPEGLATFFSEG